MAKNVDARQRRGQETRRKEGPGDGIARKCADERGTAMEERRRSKNRGAEQRYAYQHSNYKEKNSK